MFVRDLEIVPLFIAACTCFFVSCRLPEGPPAAEPPLRAWFVDVGQGDACLVRTPEGKDYLYDIGNRGAKLVSFLTSAGVDTLEAVLISHPDLDHFGAFASLQAFAVKRWYLPGTTSPDPAWSGLIAELDARDAALETPHAGLSLPWSERMEVKVLWPPEHFSGSDNDLSLVLRITHAGSSLLLTGDVEEAGENGLLASGFDLTADVLKVAHHGSRTSSSLPFLAAAEPRWAVVSCDSSVYGHPHAETLAGLRRFLPEERIIRTDVEGTIGFEMDGGGVRRIPGKESNTEY
jgi:competence protein ComEC